MIPEIVSHYQILEKLGDGGMGVVYKARDLRLDRFVAIKFLPPSLTRDDEANKRFMQEAKAASGLDHARICTIHEIDETPEGQLFLVMSYYQGETLKERIDRGAMNVSDTLGIAIQVAQGLARAHDSGIIHRDVKPANIMITHDDGVKILDFGLAKLTGQSSLTRTGSVMGTVAYMSPEQIEGEDVDQRTDIWALGVVLYEMLSGRRPFRGNSDAALLHAITHEKPAVSDLPPDTPASLKRVVSRTLERDRSARYASAGELLQQLSECQTARNALSADGTPKTPVNRRIAAVALAAVVVAAAAGLWLWYRGADARWARNQAVPEIQKLVRENKLLAAFDVAQRAETSLPNNSELEKQWPLVSKTVAVESTPPGAEIRIKEYSDVNAEWRVLGRTPLKQIRVPQGIFRAQVIMDGYDSSERIVSFTPLAAQTLRLNLVSSGGVPQGMVAIPSGALDLGFVMLSGEHDPIPGPAFFMDRYEVTNEQFKTFVDAKGYQSREHWKEPFAKDGRTLSWEEGVVQLRDATGQPGPSTWAVGTFHEGQGKFPVSGVSWYEAAAYCQFAGKSLPTIYHWGQAASVDLTQFIAPLSNFDGKGPVAVGTTRGMSRSGTYDQAGNVKEWVWNASGSERYILGGGWNDPEYKFNEPETRSPFDRSPTNGFRCAAYDTKQPLPEKLTASIPLPRRDYTREQPVDDKLFQAYRDQYLYDAKDLHATVESVDDFSPQVRREKISFDAAYDGARVTAYLLLPKNGTPPYQVVVDFPGAVGFFRKSSADYYDFGVLDFLPTSGRAVLFPVYDGTYERNKRELTSGYAREDRVYRNYMIRWVQDFMRSVDYLQTRKDIDSTKLAFFGASWGGQMGPVVGALEPRVKVVVLAMGGLSMQRALPEADTFNFVRHVKVPVLLMGGTYDYVFPLETSQRPLFNMLGTAAADKKHVTYDGIGHDLPSRKRNEMIGETLTWLDKYLGPVR